jgi:hypothetical protein
MSRRSFLLTVGLTLLLIGGGGGLLLWLIGYEQEWYLQAAIPAGPQRQAKSKQFVSGLSDLFSMIQNEDKGWEARFTDEQINSFFEEQFVQSNLSHQMLPDAVSEPRVVFDPDRVRLAFRYGSGNWSTLVSIDLWVYLIRGESAVALELEGIRAGALPFSAQSLLQHISESEVWQQNGIDFTWYRHPDSGHPVAVLRFQQQQTRGSPFQLDDLRIEKGSIAIRGRSGELGATLRTMLMLPGPRREAAQ